jgi:NADPH-dependent 7-cyano-7-deazaguanine reductase QueF
MDGESVEGVSVLRRTAVETDALISIETSDVTAWCPYEGTADYYTVRLEYWPDEYAVELMSLRDYFQTFREEKIGHEEFAQRVYDDLVTVLEPAWLRLVVDAPPRYGLEMTLQHQTEPKPASIRDTQPTTRIADE